MTRTCTFTWDGEKFKFSTQNGAGITYHAYAPELFGTVRERVLKQLDLMREDAKDAPSVPVKTTQDI